MSRDDVETTEAAAGDVPAANAGELDQQIAEHLRLGLPVATLVCAIVAGVLQGAAAVILVLAAGEMVSVIAIFWASIRTLVGETPLSGADAYALGAPRAEEEQKRAVLRALKDLEFERSVGKISDDDYATLVAKYRTEAKRLLRLLDEDALPARRKVEALVTDRLQQEGLAEPREPAPARDAATPRRSPKKAAKTRAAPATPAEIDAAAEPAEIDAPAKREAGAEIKPACASCGTRNDADAVFCKKCGARQGAAAARDDAEGSAGVADVQRGASGEEAS